MKTRRLENESVRVRSRDRNNVSRRVVSKMKYAFARKKYLLAHKN